MNKEPKFKKCCGEWPSMFSGFGLLFTWRSIECHTCKHRIEGYWLERLIKQWNRSCSTCNRHTTK